MSGTTLSFRALSGTYSNAPLPCLLPTGNLVAFYHIDPTRVPSSFSRDISHARIGGIHAFCFVITQTLLSQAPQILAPYLTADFFGLSFCICVADADHNVDAAMLHVLDELAHDRRYLRRDGKPVVVLDTLPQVTGLSSWRTGSALHLVHVARTRPLSPVSNSSDAVLALTPLEGVDSISQYISHIERSMEPLQGTGAVYHGAIPWRGSEEASSLLPSRLFGIWLYYLRMLAGESMPPSLVFIYGWNTRSRVGYATGDDAPSSLRLVEEAARSSWASPPHASSLSLSLRERVAADLMHAAEQTAAPRLVTPGEYRGRSRITHTALNWLRSFEFIHRPFRILRNAFASLSGGAR